MTNPATGETTLRLERLIPSPPGALFTHWTDPAQLLRWWAPEGYEPSIHTLDVRPGGRWRILLRRPDGVTVAMGGVYRIIEPPRRLAFSWAWEDENGLRGHESEVTVNFEAVPGGTRLVLVHQAFEGRPARDRHNNGWSTALGQLADVAAEAAGR